MVIVREKVRFVDTDLMGVVHHSNYLRWFELARVEQLRDLGISLTELLNNGIVFPITKIECEYKSSAYFDDWVIIEALLIASNKAKMEFAYQIRREKDNQILAEGYSKNLFTNSTGKIIRLSDQYFKLLRQGVINTEEIPSWANKWIGSGR